MVSAATAAESNPPPDSNVKLRQDLQHLELWKWLKIRWKFRADSRERLAKFPAKFIWPLPEWVLQAVFLETELPPSIRPLTNFTAPQRAN
jgi:hypothetical protein